MRETIAKGYIVERWTDRGFDTLTISVRRDVGRLLGGQEIMRITWQADRNKPNRSWYGCRITIETSSTSDLAAAAKLAQQLEINWYAKPADVLAQLKKRGCKQVTYDMALHEYTLVEEIKPDSKVYEITVGSVNRRVYARNAKEARKKFLEIAMDETETGSSSTRQTWAEWITTQEVRELSEYKAPALPDIELNNLEGAAVQQ